MYETIKNEFNILMVSMRESFIAMVPYLFLYSMMLMFLQFLRYFEISEFIVNYDTYLSIAIGLSNLFVPLLVLSISYHLARRLNTNSHMNVVNSFLVLISYEIYIKSGNLFPKEMSMYSLLIPIASAYFFKTYNKSFLSDKYFKVASQLNISFKYIVPLLLNYTILIVFFISLHYFLLSECFNFKDYLSQVSIETYMFLKIIWTHALWFFGIHGDIVSLALFDVSVFEDKYITNLTNKNIYDLFIIIGGSGAGLSLAIAIILFWKNQQWNKIVKLSSPFLVFNINEILIYGLPIILNRYLFIPFILVPMVNFIFSYAFLSFGFIQFVDVNVHWTTPVFINAYILSDGNLLALLLQFILIVVGILIYYPFVKMYSNSQSHEYQKNILNSSFNLKQELDANEGINLNNNQFRIIENNNYVHEIIQLISKHKLELFYQPKIDIKNNSNNSFEALIRMNLGNELKGPYFIDQFEEAGLNLIIDFWVCTQVKRDLEYLKKHHNFIPKISINLYPKTLQHGKTIKNIIEVLKGETIEFEILERTQLDLQETKGNIALLKKNNFTFAIDDFGTGYSSMQTLYDSPANTIKIDKGLVDNLGNVRANNLLESLCKLCHGLNFTIIIEGVETKEQYEFIKKCDVDYIQGFYFSEAIVLEEMFNFYNNFNTNNKIENKS